MLPWPSPPPGLVSPRLVQRDPSPLTPPPTLLPSPDMRLESVHGCCRALCRHAGLPNRFPSAIARIQA